MICNKCNFDNKEEAAFCAQCGAPLTVQPNAESAAESSAEPATEPVEETEKETADYSEERTTVLTSNDALDVIKKEESKKAQGFSNGSEP
ncbi:MAG: zinc-ribbon domain-containing protein, partial [Eubacteriales bacterium]|nr:zinc-ribbon domain-containing protein [Eubacteriales bacterium]